MVTKNKTTVIPIGPYHPLQEEPEFFKLHVEGEKVVKLEIEIGYNHRGIEKLAEDMTFDQVPFLVERICGICSSSHPFASVNAIEDVGGVDIPERAKYIRTLSGSSREFTRTCSGWDWPATSWASIRSGCGLGSTASRCWMSSSS